MKLNLSIRTRILITALLPLLLTLIGGIMVVVENVQASALARSIRDTPLRARTESAAQALATAEASDARDGSALDDGKEAA